MSSVRIAFALGTVALVGATAIGATAADEPTPAGEAIPRLVARARSTVRQLRTIGPAPLGRGSYDWPLEPFDRQHPVRAFFDDPRIRHGAHSFHFGIDIAAHDGAAIFAVAPGRARVNGENVVVVSAGRVFGYWHIVPAVSTGQHVLHHQLLGHIGAGWGHVHFAESHNHRYRNPLRPRGLGPYRDSTAPTVVTAGALDGSTVLRGRVNLVAEVFDTTEPRVPGAWRDEPVTPALVRWRLLRDGSTAIGWRTAADFRSQLMPPAAFSRIYSSATTQNRRGVRGRFLFALARGLDTHSLPDGTYCLQVAVSDTRANRSLASVDLTIANRHG